MNGNLMNSSSFFSDSITKIPFPLEKGAIYRFSMPCYKSDHPDIEIERDLEILKSQNISHIVLLAQDDECKYTTGINLREKYLEKGFVVYHFPISQGGGQIKKHLES